MITKTDRKAERQRRHIRVRRKISGTDTVFLSDRSPMAEKDRDSDRQ